MKLRRDQKQLKIKIVTTQLNLDQNSLVNLQLLSFAPMTNIVIVLTQWTGLFWDESALVKYMFKVESLVI